MECRGEGRLRSASEFGSALPSLALQELNLSFETSFHCDFHFKPRFSFFPLKGRREGLVTEGSWGTWSTLGWQEATSWLKSRC